MRRSREAFLRRKACYNNFDVLFLILFFFVVAIARHHACPVKDGPNMLAAETCWREDVSGFVTSFLPALQCHSSDRFHCSADYGVVSTPAADTKDSGTENLCENSNQNDGAVAEKKVGCKNCSFNGESVKTVAKSDRLVRDVPPALDEFRSKAINPKEKPSIHQAGSVKHRVEPGGDEYNFASASKGAKVLAFNKEAKGAPNILDKDMDKYLRSPCSAEEKFVEIELSEEALVYTIEIANFEHYSSNLKQFRLMGSLVYPAESWFELGNFTAKNIKQSQRFLLPEPKWVRYLKLVLLSHHGSEFYCTLSTFKVYGVDAVEHMLEDLISEQDDKITSEESTDEPRAAPPSVTSSQVDDRAQNPFKEDDSKPGSDYPTPTQPKEEASVDNVGEQVGELRQQAVGRIPGDSVLKIITQKVRSLDLSLSVLERYLEELNSRYGSILTDIEKEMTEKSALLEEMNSDLRNFVDRKTIIEKEVEDITSWKSIVSSQMEIIERENALLRMKVEEIIENQVHMENKGIILLLVSLVCIISAISKLLIGTTISVYRKEEFKSFCASKYSWVLLLLSCTIIVIILLL